MGVKTLFLCILLGIGIGSVIPQPNFYVPRILKQNVLKSISNTESPLKKKNFVEVEMAKQSVPGVKAIEKSVPKVKKRLSSIERSGKFDGKISDGMKALLWTIQVAEGTQIVADRCFESRRSKAYRTIFGGTILDLTNQIWSDHPRILVRKWGTASDAAGAYQFLSTTWDAMRQGAGVFNFSPESQDIVATQLIRENLTQAEISLIEMGELPASAIYALARQWASLPGPHGYSLYGQKSKSLQAIHATFNSCYAFLQ